jgi:hypothetical protein
MARYSFGSRGGKIRGRVDNGAGRPAKSPEEVVREAREAKAKAGEDYRERSLAVHGLVCARCGREFSGKDRRLLTVHHKDGNHHNNPADGSNWENLCVYCHDDAHSRGVLGEYVDGSAAGDERRLVYSEEPDEGGAESGVLGDLLKKALEEKGKKER